MPAQISPENVRKFDGKTYRKVDATRSKAEANRLKRLFKTRDTLVRITEGKWLGKKYYDVWINTPHVEEEIRRLMR